MINFSAQKKFKSGYSVLEMLITLLVVNILILMLSNILVISLRISLEINERSVAREELTNISNLMKRDIRNANTIGVDCLTVNETTPTCTIDKGNETVRWRFCPVMGNAPRRICKHTINAAGNESSIPVYQSTTKLNFTGLTFQDAEGNVTSTPTSNASILITMTADHASANVDIKNLYRQVLASTLNFSY